jgi:predicted MFS family arabinose efflux permease
MIALTLRLFKTSYGGLSKRIWLLGFVMLVNRCGTMVLPFLTSYCTRDKHFSTTQAGWVAGIYGIGAMCGALLGGRLSDRLGFSRVQGSSLLLGGVSFIGLGYIDTYPALCAGTFLLSMLNEAFRPANAAAISHYSTPETRTRSFSLIRLAINIGWGVGAALAGFLASMDYQYLFWTDGLTNIGAAILLWRLLPRVPLNEQRQIRTPKSAPVQSAYRDSVFMRFMGLKVLFALCFFQLFTTLPLFYYEEWGLNERWYGVFMAVNGIMIALIEMPVVFKMEGRRPYLTYIASGTVLTGLFFFLLNINGVNVILLGFVSMIVATIAEIIAMPFMNSYYIARSTNENRGQYAGLYTLGWSLAQCIASTTGTQVAHWLGFDTLWWILGIVCILTAWGFYRLERGRIAVSTGK